MGRKHSGPGKQLYLCVALLMILGPTACALMRPADLATRVPTAEEAARDQVARHLQQGWKLLGLGDFPGALRENDKALALADKQPPADQALFALGLIHAHPGNPARDYGKSQALFKRLRKDYPASPLVEQARTLTSLMEDNEKLAGTIDRLSTIIDELKKVDIDLDQKKREQSK